MRFSYKNAVMLFIALWINAIGIRFAIDGLNAPSDLKVWSGIALIITLVCLDFQFFSWMIEKLFINHNPSTKKESE